MIEIMVVDDSIFMCDEIAHQLTGSSFEVVSKCRDAEEAIKNYSTFLPDIVIMDVILPGMDGFDATTAILSKWKDAKVIIISSLAYDDTVERANKVGAKSVLFKPFTQKDLLAVLEK